MKENYAIRRETPADERLTETIIRESFWNVYRPGCLEHYVMHCLRRDKAFIPELNFVLEVKDEMIGQAACMKATVQCDDGSSLPIMTLGPICILPSFQRKGWGKIILDYTLARAAELGYGAVCFEGNIQFYGKSGFGYASDFGIRYHGLPAGADSSFFLCKELKQDYLTGITGEYATPQGYFVDETACEEFDKQFPPKAKIKGSWQIF